MSAKIRKGDKVIVLTGRDKGKSGEVIEVRPDEARALVRGINIVRRHQRQTTQSQGGIISKEAPIHIRIWRSPIRRNRRSLRASASR